VAVMVMDCSLSDPLPKRKYIHTQAERSQAHALGTHSLRSRRALMRDA
jgi:hypothetical protein